MPPTNTHTTFDWEVVLDALEDQKCVLFLGPQLYTAPGGGVMEEALAEALDAQDPDNPFIRNYYEEDGFFLFREARFRRRVVRQIRQFYEQPFPESQELLEKVARIPFHLIFLMTPDNLLLDTLRRGGYPFQHDFYFRNQPAKDYVFPTRDNPLIYHMLGCLEEDESLVLTHNDLFDYLHSVFNSNSMHQELKTELADAYNYLFLGLPFEKWYLQLLLRVLSLHTDKLKSLERFASRPEAPTEKGLFEEQFNIEFVPDQAPAFIEELYRQCEGRGLLRPLPEQSGHGTVEAAFAKIQKWIARADIQKAMEELKGLLEPYRPRSEELLRELLLLMSSYQNLEKQSQLGIDGPEAGKEKNRIIYALLNLMDEAKKLT